MDPYILFDSDELIGKIQLLQATAASHQAKSLVLLTTVIKRKDSALQAQLVENARLSAEVTSLKGLVQEMDKDYQALQASAATKINQLSRELYPEGSWRWTWEGGRRVEGTEKQDPLEAVVGTLSTAQKQELVETLRLAAADVRLKVIGIAKGKVSLKRDATLTLKFESLSEEVVTELYNFVVQGIEGPGGAAREVAADDELSSEKSEEDDDEDFDDDDDDDESCSASEDEMGERIFTGTRKRELSSDSVGGSRDVESRQQDHR